jgi:hypothetical protein
MGRLGDTGINADLVGVLCFFSPGEAGLQSSGRSVSSFNGF